MHSVVRLLGCVLLLGAAAGCGLQRTPPPDFPIQAYGGTGDRMAECMRYASESYCEREIWGGGEP
jgi:hypothetical protein